MVPSSLAPMLALERTVNSLQHTLGSFSLLSSGLGGVF